MGIINPATSARTSSEAHNLLLQSVTVQMTILNWEPFLLISSESYGRCQASGPSSDAAQSHMWKTQSIPASGALQHYDSRTALGRAVRHCTPGTHPYKAQDTGYVP